MNKFDIKAQDWDKNTIHWERSIAIAKEMEELLPLNNKMSAMEYGAGTGILSFLLKDRLGDITLMDNSTEMVKITDEKIKQSKSKNIIALFFDLEHQDFTDQKFDLIFTQMVLHHVADIDKIITKFNQLLNPGGYLVIADLYQEDGTFHDEDFKGHPGFDIEKFAGLISEHQFKSIVHKECFVIKRQLPNDTVKEFPVFLLVAKRN
jgi:tRNA (cmo5U34)-methyltransferase